MHKLVSERLLLRPYKEDDFEAIHAYASHTENTKFMLFGPNSEEDTRNFIMRQMSGYIKTPVEQHAFVVEAKNTGKLIGACDLNLRGFDSELGWILHRDFWNMGYGTEIGHALLKFGFDGLGFHRMIARCHVDNVGSYRVMEKIGMRREALHLDCRKNRSGADKPLRDEYLYAILRDEWDVRKEIEYYNSLPCFFNGFIDVPLLTNGEVHLVCTDKGLGNNEADRAKKRVPMYSFAICKGSEKIGDINLRIGYTEGLYYGGQIGYGVDEVHRGNGYAVEACKLLIPIAKAHRMDKLLITNNHENKASMRVCEKLGLKLIRTLRLPEWTDIYASGQRFTNIYEWTI